MVESGNRTGAEIARLFRVHRSSISPYRSRTAQINRERSRERPSVPKVWRAIVSKFLYKRGRRFEITNAA
jgi:hypothetical protein